MSDMPTTCPACGVDLGKHWCCAVCRCFGHRNVQCRGDRAICQDCDKALAVRGARRCRNCGEIRTLEAFRVVPSGRMRQCKACEKVKRKAYSEANREREIAYARAWAEQNKERRAASWKAYYARNAEERRADTRKRYWEHREERLATARRWHREHIEERIAYNRRYRRAHILEQRDRARRRWHRRKLAILQEIRNGRPD